MAISMIVFIKRKKYTITNGPETNTGISEVDKLKFKLTLLGAVLSLHGVVAQLGIKSFAGLLRMVDP